MNEIISIETVQSKILKIRNQEVILDRDLAELYEVETRRLNEQVKRNVARFPEDFMFQLTKDVLENWRSQIATSNPAVKMGLRQRPYAFTENGVAMLSSVLNSEKAIQVNIQIMRAFNTFRKIISFSDFIELKAKHEELRNAIIAILSHEKEQNEALQSLSDEIEFIDSKFVVEVDRLDKMLHELKSKKVEVIIIEEKP